MHYLLCYFSEEHIALAILRLIEMEKAVVEGAGAIGLAAILANQVPELKGKKCVAYMLHCFSVADLVCREVYIIDASTEITRGC